MLEQRSEPCLTASVQLFDGGPLHLLHCVEGLSEAAAQRYAANG
jgi:hypothetical protein